jgi:hypothetical protein
MFSAFGLKPALGRLLAESDDTKPKASPVAVLSYGYWSQRFGRDPGVIGRKVQLDNDLYEIIGIAPEGFTGTEPGTFTDIFLPCTMYEGATHDDWGWLRTFIQMKPGGVQTRVRGRLQTIWTTVQTERAKGFTSWPAERRAKYLQQQIVLESAAGGLSFMQRTYRVALLCIGVIVGLVFANRMFEYCQSAQCTSCRPIAGNGTACLDWSRQIAPDSTRHRRKRVTGGVGNRSRLLLCMVVSALHRGENQSSR